MSNGSVGIKLPDGTDVACDGYEFDGTPEDGRPAVLGVRPEQIDLKSAAQRTPSTLPVNVVADRSDGRRQPGVGPVGKDTMSVRIGADETYRIGETPQGRLPAEPGFAFDAESGARL